MEKPTFSNVNMSETSQKFSTESHGRSVPLTDRRFDSAEGAAAAAAAASFDDVCFVVICGNNAGLLVRTAVCGRRITSSQNEQTIVWVFRSPAGGNVFMEIR